MLQIPQPLAQAIADYLAQRPYREVAQLIAALQQIEPGPEKIKDTGADTSSGSEAA